MKELWLAIEGGGTKTRLLLAEPAGAVLAAYSGGSSNPLYVDRQHYEREMGGILQKLKRDAGRRRQPITAIGIAGPMNTAQIRRLVSANFGRVRIVQTGEGQVALACHGLTTGIALIAGTGSSARYIGPRGREVTCGGLGPQFGDEGSGYWIGRAAIAAAMDAEARGGRETTLVADLCGHFTLRRMWDGLNLADRSGHVPAPAVASCVPVVFDAARRDDSVAREICRKAGALLGELVLKTARKSRVRSGTVDLALAGGVFHGGPLITAPLRAVLRSSPVAFRVYPAVVDPAYGLLKFMAQHVG